MIAIHHHVGVVVQDVARSTDLLVQLLDAEVLPAPSAGHTLLRVGGIHLALVPRQDGDPTVRAWGEHLAFSVPPSSRAELVARLDRLGCVHEDVRGRLYARDADGLTLELLFA